MNTLLDYTTPTGALPLALPAARLGAPEGGALAAESVERLLECLLAVAPPGRIVLGSSLLPLWGPRLEALGRACTSLVLGGTDTLDTLIDATAKLEPGDQVWLNLDRIPPLDPLDLMCLEAFLAYAGSRPVPPLVVLLGDDSPYLGRTQRMAVDRQGNLMLLRHASEAAYALGPRALLAAMAAKLPCTPLPPLPVLPAIRQRELLVLDVDGVLINPGRSFSDAVAGALAELEPTLVWDDTYFAAFKRVGGFNNDFRLTAAALALAEEDGLWQLESAVGVGFPHLEGRIRALEPLCQTIVQKHYARTRRLERPLVTRQELAAFKGDLAIFTGRPPEELAMAFEVLGFRLPAVSDNAPHLRKPRPEGLLQLADTFRARRITFVGDTCDDAAALRAARDLRPELTWTFAGVGPERAHFTREEDLQAASLQELLGHAVGGSLA